MYMIGILKVEERMAAREGWLEVYKKGLTLGREGTIKDRGM